ncbi:MAG: hypothetical protein RBS80_05925 [Thermoguttaceae bacterium]|jgi:hypothetical protein|nr:hypothetical protein [Thermoguttaceae bacterium]
MNSLKPSALEEVQVVGRLEGLRKILLGEEYAEHLQKPLAYWALPTDRRLPLAFLGRRLEDLLNTPFGELAATPGIGQKKLNSFVMLLARAANTDPADIPAEETLVRDVALSSPKAAPTNGDGFDPASVSEVVWSQWRASVAKHNLGDEPLGRFAPSLRHMTRVIWSTPLSAYVNRTLAEMRNMRTHGEKRIHAILEVFHSLHALVANMGVQQHLMVRIVPRLVDQVEQWVGQTLQTPGMPSAEELAEHFVEPLLAQVRIDVNQQIAALAENRLGMSGPITSVRQAARAMGLTRARVYQLLNEINDVMIVRWPMGRHQVYELREKLYAEAAQMRTPPDLRQFLAAVELFYPGARRGAAGPLEQASEKFEAPERREAVVAAS